MAGSIKPFENSLRDYLINAHADSYNTIQKIQYRYNNLKIYMDPKKNRTPHFTVALGISEATFGIEPVDVISGSLSNDTRYVYMWASRPNINGELKKHWAFLTLQTSGVSIVALTDEEKKKVLPPSAKEAEERKRQQALEALEAAEHTTGSGIRRHKTIQDALKRDNRNIMKPDDEIDK